jgi:hypothetical protein
MILAFDHLDELHVREILPQGGSKADLPVFVTSVGLIAHHDRYFGLFRPLQGTTRDKGGDLARFVQNGPQFSRFRSRRMATG